MDPGKLFLCFCKRNCGITEPDATRQATSDATVPCDDCAVGDFKMPGNADLSCHCDMFAHECTPGDTSLCHDHGIFSDHDVVRDLHEIVDLHAFLDPCPAIACSINSCVSADL